MYRRNFKKQVFLVSLLFNKSDVEGYLFKRGIILFNHNYNKIVKSDWLSTALISALIGQFNRTVRVMAK